MSKERDGYYYPLSGQAASVRAMLEREMDRYKVEVHCDETLQRIIPRKDLSGQNITGYEVQTDRDKYLVRKLILAVGGSAAPAQVRPEMVIVCCRNLEWRSYRHCRH